MPPRSYSMLAAVLALIMLVSGCTSPQPPVDSPRNLIGEYVLAYNSGDAETIYGMLLIFDTPQHHPQYATKKDVEQAVREKRVNAGIRIAEYFIVEEFLIENYAVISLEITWERDGTVVAEQQDVGFVYRHGEWNMVDLVLPPTM